MVRKRKFDDSSSSSCSSSSTYNLIETLINDGGRFLFLHQLYNLLPNRMQVDNEIKELRDHGIIRLFHSINSANEIRQIDSQIEKILEIGDDYKKLQYIGSTIPALVEEGIPSTLSKIEKDLAELRTRYRDTDKIIIRKISERDSLIKLLRQQAIGYLNARKLRAKSIMESAIRPKGILLKYKELIRQAKRDESTLISLENQLRAIDLEQSRLEDPWELITKPTLLKESVGPSRSKLALLGLFAGFVVSSLIAIFKEYKSA